MATNGRNGKNGRGNGHGQQGPELVVDDQERGLFRVHRSVFTDPDILAMERGADLRQVLDLRGARVGGAEAGRLRYAAGGGAAGHHHAGAGRQDPRAAEHVHAPGGRWCAAS